MEREQNIPRKHVYMAVSNIYECHDLQIVKKTCMIITAGIPNSRLLPHVRWGILVSTTLCDKKVLREVHFLLPLLGDTL